MSQCAQAIAHSYQHDEKAIILYDFGHFITIYYTGQSWVVHENKWIKRAFVIYIKSYFQSCCAYKFCGYVQVHAIKKVPSTEWELL